MSTKPKTRKLAVVAPSTDPKVVAEGLLRKVIGDEAHTQLCATGQFTVTVESGNKYTFSRQSKTVVEKDGRRYSCCIEFEDYDKPRADQLAAEYLLALNDEAKYLSTANLTDITPATHGELTMQGITNRVLENLRNHLRFDRMVYDPGVGGVVGGRVGDTIQVRRPARYGTPPTFTVDPEIWPRPPRLDRLTCTQICQHALHLLLTELNPPRLPNLPYQVTRGLPNVDPRVVNIELPPITSESLDLPLDHFTIRFLTTPVMVLANSIRSLILTGYMELPLPGGVDQSARAVDPNTNFNLRLVKYYDIRYNSYTYQLSSGLVVRT